MGFCKHIVVLVAVVSAVLLLDHHLAESAHAPAPESPYDPFVQFFYYDSDALIDDGVSPTNDVKCHNLIVGRQHYKVDKSTTGSCVHTSPIRFKDKTTGSVYSFSTKFVVYIYLGSPLSNLEGYGVGAKNSLEGFTFALLPGYNQSGGGDGGYLGLLNATSNGSNQSHTFAVEFDFVESPEFSDTSTGFHLGLDINNMNSTSWTYLNGPTGHPQDLWRLQVWIDYDGPSEILTVSTLDITEKSCPVSDEERPAPVRALYNDSEVWNSFSQIVDLSDVLNDHMYVGFTSSWYPYNLQFQYIWQRQWISDWSFRTSNSSTPAAPSAPLPCNNLKVPSFFAQYLFEIRLTSSLVGLSILAAICRILYKCYCRWDERRGWRFNLDADDLGAGVPHQFTYKELALATKNFDPKQELGRGGFGKVYKAFLPGNEQDVAVKRVSPESNQGEREFVAEVMIIGKIRHRNLVRLQGWCNEKGELLLVYDYMPHGSLDKLLFGNHAITQELPTALAQEQEEVALNNIIVVNKADVKLPWERRFKVIVDVATALVYLHTECEERIIHRDVKAANVMLDAKFRARLGDFGLARSYNHSLLTPESTNVAGTRGYLAPELFHTGKQTEQTDVYSFGALLLEVACGRRPIYHQDDDWVVLVDHVWEKWGNSQILDTADPKLAGMYDENEMTKVLCLGLLCSHPSPAMRPSMRRVLLILNGDIDLPQVPPSKPRVGGDIQRTLSQDISWSTTSGSIHAASETRAERLELRL